MTTTAQKKEGGGKLPALIARKADREKDTPAASPRDGITYSEDAAAERVGIPLDDLQWLRKGCLTPGTHYTREAGFVRINGVGISRIEDLLAKGRTLIVTGTQIPNPQLVLAKLPGGSDVIRVRVADRDSWCRGMVIEDGTPTENPKIWSTSIKPQFKGRA